MNKMKFKVGDKVRVVSLEGTGISEAREWVRTRHHSLWNTTGIITSSHEIYRASLPYKVEFLLVTDVFSYWFADKNLRHYQNGLEVALDIFNEFAARNI